MNITKIKEQEEPPFGDNKYIKMDIQQQQEANNYFSPNQSQFDPQSMSLNTSNNSSNNTTPIQMQQHLYSTSTEIEHSLNNNNTQSPTPINVMTMVNNIPFFFLFFLKKIVTNIQFISLINHHKYL